MGLSAGELCLSSFSPSGIAQIPRAESYMPNPTCYSTTHSFTTCLVFYSPKTDADTLYKLLSTKKAPVSFGVQRFFSPSKFQSHSHLTPNKNIHHRPYCQLTCLVKTWPRIQCSKDTTLGSRSIQGLCSHY